MIWKSLRLPLEIDRNTLGAQLDRMRRREFLAGAASLGAVGRANAQAVQPGKIPLVTYLGYGGNIPALTNGFHAGMLDLGWDAGRNYQLVERWANNDPSLVSAYARELLQ